MGEKVRIYKNLASLAFGHFLVFTAFDSLSNLQSTLNPGVGPASQAVVYALFTLSAFFLPTWLIRRFGCKRTLLISVFSACPYVAANLRPAWATLLPAAALSGLAFGPLWAARSKYVNELSFRYSALTNAPVSVVNAWFFGLYSFFHENAEIWGNVISYNVLKDSAPGNASFAAEGDSAPWNASFAATPDYATCGAGFCEGASSPSTNPNLQPPPDAQRSTLVLVYLVFVCLAGFVILFVMDPLDEEGTSKEGLSCDALMATLKHMKNRDQLLLIPLSFYCGLADGFYNSDFTKAYVACAWGISQVGHVTICYGVVSAIVDCSSGFLVKYLTRLPVFLTAACSHFVMFGILLAWRPLATNYSLYFILSGIYGVGASVWWSQIIAFYGIIFKENEEPAFSNFYFWSSLGFSIAYGYSDSLCTDVKIYILIVLLLIGISAYSTVEIRFSCRNTEKNSQRTDSKQLNVNFENTKPVLNQ